MNKERKEFAISDVTTGQLNALVKNLMRETDIKDPMELIRRINSGEYDVQMRKRWWYEDDESICFSVKTDFSAPSKDWLDYLRRRGFIVFPLIEKLLSSLVFPPKKMGSIEIVVLRSTIFAGKECIIDAVLTEAEKRNLAIPSIEDACIIRTGLNNAMLNAFRLSNVMVMHDLIDVLGDQIRLVMRPVCRPSCDVVSHHGDFAELGLDSLGFAFVRRQPAQE